MAAALSLLAACEDVTGVDVSWSLEALDGTRVDSCLTARVAAIRLFWQVDGAPEQYEQWPCGDSNAVTRTSVPPGDALLWVKPVCTNGELAHEASYEAPAPVARHIARGEVVTLNTVLIMVNTDCRANCDGGKLACSECCVCAQSLPDACAPDDAGVDAADGT